MKKFCVSVVQILVLASIWFGLGGALAEWKKGDSSASARSITGLSETSVAEKDAMKMKVAVRKETPRRTHSPARLRDFMLPEIVLNGENLPQALQKLMSAYDEICLKSGETPLRLTFVTPEENQQQLHLRLVNRSFSSAVNLLAAVSGLKVTRKDLEYRFEMLADSSGERTVRLASSSGLVGTLKDMLGEGGDSEDPSFPPPSTSQMTEYLVRMGLRLDASTRLFDDPKGGLVIESDNPADVAAISALFRENSMEKLFQHKLEGMALEIPAGMDWREPTGSQMDEGEVQHLIREMAKEKGIQLETFPAITARNGQPAKVEMVNELVSKKEGSENASETHQLGKVMHFRPNAIGFGQEVEIGYTHTTGELDSVSGRAIITKQSEMNDAKFIRDQGLGITTQTHPDGSRTVFITTSQLIDATGRPFRGE